MVLGLRRGEELDHAADAAVVVEDRPPVVPVLRGVGEPVGEVTLEDGCDRVHVGVEVRGVGVAEDERVGDRLRDLGLAATGDRARLVAAGGCRDGADEAPLRAVGRLLHHAHLVAVRAEVDLVRAQAQRALAAVRVVPGDGEGAQRERRVGGHQDDVRLLRVEHVALGLRDEASGVALEDAGEGVLRAGGALVVLLPQVVAGEHQRAAGVLLLGVAEQVRRVADLGLDLLLAVAEVVVGDHRDHHAAGVAGADLERLATVVELVGIRPAHAVAPLAVGCLAGVRQSQGHLGDCGEVRREDDRAGVARPGLRLQGGVVLRQVGVAAVAEDAFDEVEVGHETTGNDEPGLHALLTHIAGHGRGNQRTQLEGDEAGRRHLLVGGVGQHQVDLRRLERELQQPGEHGLRHTDLVVGDGQATLGDVEDAGRGASVVRRVVQDAVGQPVAAQQRGGVGVGVVGQRQLAGEAGLVEHERPAGQLGAHPGVGEVVVQPVLDATVGSAQAIGKAAAQLTLPREDRRDELRRLRVLDLCR